MKKCFCFCKSVTKNIFLRFSSERINNVLGLTMVRVKCRNYRNGMFGYGQKSDQIEPVGISRDST